MRFTQHAVWLKSSSSWSIGKWKRWLSSSRDSHTLQKSASAHTHTCSERLRPTLSWAHKRWDHWTETWRMPPNQTSELWAHALLSLNNREKSQSYSREDDKTTNRICHHPKCQGTTWNQPTWLLRWTRDHWF